MKCLILFFEKSKETMFEKKKKKKNVISSLSAKLVKVNKYVSQRDDS